LYQIINVGLGRYQCIYLVIIHGQILHKIYIAEETIYNRCKKQKEKEEKEEFFKIKKQVQIQRWSQRGKEWIGN
jgi:hypothetical protein